MLASVGLLIGLWAASRRVRSIARVRALASQPPAWGASATVQAPEGAALLEDARLLLAQLELPAEHGPGALMTQTGGPPGDALLSFLEQDAHAWLRAVEALPEPSRDELAGLGITPGAAAVVLTQVQRRTKAGYADALVRMHGFETALTRAAGPDPYR